MSLDYFRSRILIGFLSGWAGGAAHFNLAGVLIIGLCSHVSMCLIERLVRE